jgi:hypothetical protein
MNNFYFKKCCKLDAGFIIGEMKKNMIRFGTLFLPMILVLGLQAQQAVLSASNETSGSTGTVSYSVGQVAYILNAGTGGFLIQGVQQPFEYQFHIGIEETTMAPLKCFIYPNPASNYTKLKIERQELKNFSYQLYNMNGFLLQNMKIVSQEVSISVEDLAPASYNLTVSENERPLQSFIIIKR